MIKTEENKEKNLNEERERERQLDTISESDRSENDILIEGWVYTRYLEKFDIELLNDEP